MSAAPWTVSIKKRRSVTPSPSTGRKRHRASEGPSSDGRRQQTLTQAQWIDRATSFSEPVDLAPLLKADSGSRKQQTLTQAQWIDRPVSFSEDLDLIPLEEAKTSKRKTARKQASTLTQMPFFSSAAPQEHDLSVISLEDEHTAEIPSIPQLDGPYHSPRRPKKRIKLESAESQEYQPTTRVRNADIEPAQEQSRRSSRRLAEQPKIFSDPAENLDYFKEALKPEIEARPRLEIQDSTADTEIVSLRSQSPIKTPARPSRVDNGTTVPSSQTPDSIGPTTKSTGRRPLRDVPSNVQAFPSPPRVYKQSPFGNKSAKGTVLRKPNKAKVRDKVDDSQSDLWSIHPTSSVSKRVSHVNDENHITSSPPPGVAAGLGMLAEIPSTSQIETEISHDQEEAPVGNGVDENAGRTPTGSNGSGRSVMFANGRPALPDGARAPDVAEAVDGIPDAIVACPQIAAHRLAIDPAEPMHMLADNVPGDEEGDFDIGSPIRNDTQYNHEVTERTSSPTPESAHPSAGDENREPTPVCVFKAPTQPTASSRPPFETAKSGSSTHSLELPPPPPPAAPTSYRGYMITRVPLNDLLPTSSPPEQSTKSTTQRSVRPAAMPHPSQMSTQEATQGYTGSSFLPMETPRATRQITIKDSSSAGPSLSQIPPQPPTQQLDIDLGDGAADFGGQEEGEEEDDYDLDPPSVIVQQPLELPASRPCKAPEVESRIAIPTEKLYPTSSSPDPAPQMDQRHPFQEQSLDKAPRNGRRASIPTNNDHKPVASRRTANMSPEKPKFIPQAYASISTSKSGPKPSPRSVSPTRSATAANNNLPNEMPDDNDNASSPPSSPPLLAEEDDDGGPTPPRPLAKPLNEYTQLEGYNNDTQSNFTQGGHVTAAYVHRQRELGLLPKGFTPQCFKVPRPRVPGFTRR